MVATNITIDPVTRLEGHGKIVVDLSDAGAVEQASFRTVEFRGFEKFCEGRMIWDMPTITSRICGFCPVSHHLASVKATENLLGVTPPPTAHRLRELLHMGQTIQSHALHFFFCGMPDFLGDELKVADRSVFGLLDKHKALAGNAIKLRKAGQDIIDRVGGGRLHPVSCIPGGMSKHLDYLDRVEMLKGLVGGVRLAKMAVETIKDYANKNREFFDWFASFPSLYMSLTKDDNLELYDGQVRICDQDGSILTDFEPVDYLNYIEEETDPRTWMKAPRLRPSNGSDEVEVFEVDETGQAVSPAQDMGQTRGLHLKSRGPDTGFYRVAPLARLNVARGISTPQANAEFQEYRKLTGGKPIESILFYHYARMIELLYAVERSIELLKDPEILSQEVRVPVERKGGQGVGVVEAPRGTLFHHYWANDDGRITKVNLIVSTAHNKTAMDRSVKMIAEGIIKDGQIAEKDLNKLEMAIRCYDPCLSCSTHAWGKMPLEVEVRNKSKTVLETYRHGDLAR